MTFVEMLRARWQQANSMLCVGLDSDYAQIPEACKTDDVYQVMKGFNFSVIAMTHNFVCAYKPNSAFYEDEWLPGLQALQETFSIIRSLDPAIPIILDAKRTDIGNTNKGYAKMAFDVLGADAITVNPYFGGEALKPFLDKADKGVIVLCRTSNPGAKDFQDTKVYLDDLPLEAEKFFASLDGVVEKDIGSVKKYVPLYQWVAYKASTEWNKNGNVLLVVGATYPDELRKVRKIVGDNMPILVPGIGAQQGDLEATVRAGLDSSGFGMIINSARGIIFASKEGDFNVVAQEANKLRDQINEIKANILQEAAGSS